MAKPTIREVAKLASVSVSVASNALNNKGRVNVETRDRVKLAARSLGYVPNYSARRLRGEGGAIGVIITDTLEDAPLERFVGESLYWFYHLTYDLGYKLHHIHLPSIEFSETKLLDILSDGAIDGAIFLVPRISQIETIIQVMDQLNHLPHIFVSATLDLPNESFVDSDGKSGAAVVVQHLLAKGHKKIGYLMPSDGYDQFNAVDRLRGVQEEVGKAGLELFVYAATKWEEKISLDEIAADKITAIITWNDIFALRVISKLNRMGLKVPQDIAVIGFDDELFSKWTFPKITTVSQPIADMSRAAVDYLLTQIKSGEIKILRKRYPMQLIIRESG